MPVTVFIAPGSVPLPIVKVSVQGEDKGSRVLCLDPEILPGARSGASG